ncbi:MAG: hypothetical protein ACPGQD_03430, partial [Planctomycetota bacterium]
GARVARIFSIPHNPFLLLGNSMDTPPRSLKEAGVAFGKAYDEVSRAKRDLARLESELERKRQRLGEAEKCLRESARKSDVNEAIIDLENCNQALFVTVDDQGNVQHRMIQRLPQ